MWTIRQADAGDHRALLSLHRELYLTYRDTVLDHKLLPLIGYRDYDALLERDLANLLRNKDAFVFVAEHNTTQEALGYISGRLTNEPMRELPKRAIIEDWFIRQNVRGQGIGGALLNKLEQYFRDRGCEVVESTTWMSNESGRRAHARAGFSEVQVAFRKKL
ncbi:MAG: GNAT family N-acetyltransferase [Polyangiales bacterium]